MTSYDDWRELAAQLRVDSIRATTQAGSGHPTSSLSAADLMAVLMAQHLRYDFANPRDPHNDHLVFSKGHASPLLYAMFKAAGAITDAELMSMRRAGSRLEGHPTPVLPWVEVATGSLGQGLAIGVGIALAGARLDRLPYRVWVLSGDSEMAEGSVWEAVEHAAHYRLANLTCIVDVNRLGQRGPTMLEWNTAAYAARARAFGWETLEIDGHDLRAIDDAYRRAAAASGAPMMILARTVKGKGVPAIENRDNWHGKALPKEDAEQAIGALGGRRSVVVDVRRPEDRRTSAKPPAGSLVLPSYKVGDSVATRRAYGDALRALGAARAEVVVLDGEVSNSTYADEFARAFPERYFEMYIAEQQMVAAAVGLQVRGYVPFASSFAAFLTRAYDFIRMAAVSRANVRLCGSHAGVSIGQDGPSQMGLEDLAMMRAVGGSTVLYPCDPNQTAQLVAAMADRSGIVYLRTTREKTPVIYPADRGFPIGGSVVVRRSDRDQATVVGAGITLHEALRAADVLAKDGIPVRVIDAYSVKPIDERTLLEAARETGALVVVEDHWPEGGLGEAVRSALAGSSPAPQVVTLAVGGMPGSGTPEEMLASAGIGAASIAGAVRSLVPLGRGARG